jgi:hypothetical protein
MAADIPGRGVGDWDRSRPLVPSEGTILLESRAFIEESPARRMAGGLVAPAGHGGAHPLADPGGGSTSQGAGSQTKMGISRVVRLR